MSISSFDNLDDMFEQMRRDQEAADSVVLPWQAAIRPGDYVCRSGPDFLIYSEILDDPEPRLDDPEPREVEMQHYRFTRSYSIACPTGELGDIHVSTVERKLLRDEFLEMKERGWG